MDIEVDRIYGVCKDLVNVVNTLNASKEDPERAKKLVQDLKHLADCAVFQTRRIENVREKQRAHDKNLKELQLKIAGAAELLNQLKLLKQHSKTAVTETIDACKDKVLSDCSPDIKTEISGITLNPPSCSDNKGYNLSTPDVGPRVAKIVPKKLVLAIIEPLTDQELSTIPRYMLGRTTLAILNSFIENFNNALAMKYETVPKRRGGKVAPARKSFEDDELKGKMYITDAELAEALNMKLLDKKSLNFLTCLRHCKKLNIIRRGTVTVYIP